jgi:hypothetical protein
VEGSSTDEVEQGGSDMDRSQDKRQREQGIAVM